MGVLVGSWGVERKRLVLALWAIPFVALLAAVVCLLTGATVVGAVLVLVAGFSVEPVRRFTVPNLPVVLDAHDAAEVREIRDDEGETAAVRRVRELHPRAGLAAAARAVREL